jgi:hypothetical protein
MVRVPLPDREEALGQQEVVQRAAFGVSERPQCRRLLAVDTQRWQSVERVGILAALLLPGCREH